MRRLILAVLAVVLVGVGFTPATTAAPAADRVVAVAPAGVVPVPMVTQVNRSCRSGPLLSRFHRIRYTRTLDLIWTTGTNRKTQSDPGFDPVWERTKDRLSRGTFYDYEYGFTPNAFYVPRGLTYLGKSYWFNFSWWSRASGDPTHRSCQVNVPPL